MPSPWTVLVLFGNGAFILATEGFGYFERFFDIDGKICDPANVLFSSFSPTLLYCGILCGIDTNCASLFFLEANVTCYGCSEAYTNGNGLQVLIGTEYAHDPGLMTTTSTTTSTSTSTSTSTMTSTSTSISTSTTTSTTTALCEADWEYFEGYCYTVPYTTGDFDAAVDYCKNVDGNIVHISSAEENTFIGDILTARLGNKFKIYIGLTEEIGSEGDWRWNDDGSMVTYHNWRPGQPEINPEQNCAGFTKSSKGINDWMDVFCQLERNFVCEKSN